MMTEVCSNSSATSGGFLCPDESDSEKSMEDDEYIMMGADALSEQLQTGSNNKERINELEEKVIKLQQKVNGLEGHNGSLELEVQDLKTDISKLRSELKTKKDEILLLQQQVHDLEDKFAKTKTDSNKIYLSQIAVVFEQAICFTVLPEVFKNSWQHPTLEDLLNHLYYDHEEDLPLDPKQYETCVVLDKARERWGKICHDLEVPTRWKTRDRAPRFIYNGYFVPKIFKAILLLKQERNEIAHPKSVSLQQGQDIVSKEDFAMQLGLDSDQLELAKSFIMSVGLHIQKSGVQIDRRKLVA